MSKAIRTSPDLESSDQAADQELEQLPHEGTLEAEQQRSTLVTADQYVRQANLDEAVSGLIRSLHKTKIMSLAEWEHEASVLLTKKTW